MCDLDGIVQDHLPCFDQVLGDPFVGCTRTQVNNVCRDQVVIPTYIKDAARHVGECMVRERDHQDGANSIPSLLVV